MDELKAIGAEMAVQDNRGGQYPMYAIQSDKEVWVQTGEDYDNKVRKEFDEISIVDLCESCAKLFEDDEQIPDECGMCDEDSFDHYKLEDQFELMPGIFFTEKAAQQHIDENHYHYLNPRIYGVGAWRNPEMVAVQQHLIELSGNALPSHYL